MKSASAFANTAHGSRRPRMRRIREERKTKKCGNEREKEGSGDNSREERGKGIRDIEKRERGVEEGKVRERIRETDRAMGAED